MPVPFPILAALGACGDGPAGDDGKAAEEWRPDVVCPGDDGCADNEGELLAGASAVAITPDCFETWDDLDENGEWDKSVEPYYDCGCDRLCEGDDGYPGPDEGEGDGEFQAVWIAGFSTGRAATGVHDDLWARAVALRSGDTTVAIVALDVVGYFYNEVQTIRQLVADRGVDVDHVVVHSSHGHEGPDTLGQWGERPGKSGMDREYQDSINESVADAVADAVATLEPVRMFASSIDTAAPYGDKGTRNTVRDSRDPVIIDEVLYTARFEATDGTTVATVVNWGNHPEVLSGENTSITSDFAHYLREGVEGGVAWESGSREGLGGTCVFVNAAVGGLMTPLGITVTDGDGNEFTDPTFEKAEALGKVLAGLALDAAEGETEATDPRVAVRASQLYVPIHNIVFQAAFLMDLFDRPVYNYDPESDLDENNVPELLTEVDLVTVGPVAMLTVPGELFPELAIGGYDGSRVNTTEDEFIASDNPNPPDVSQAPAGPFWKELAGGEWAWIVGLGNDEIGYLIPSYDYELDEDLPYWNEPPGDHYEETNSVGPEAVPRLEEAVERLLGWEG